MAQLSVPVNEEDHTQGPADAPCTLVEYGDFECPSCGQAYGIVKQLQRHFGDQLRFVFREFPLEQHAMAEPAAEAAEFAAKQGSFWPMHDGLFDHQDELSEDLFAELADDLRLDPKALIRSLEEGEFQGRVEKDLASGEASGVHGTPTFFLNGERHDGAYDLRSLQHAISAALGR